VKVSYNSMAGVDMFSPNAKPTLLTSRVEPTFDISNASLPAETKGQTQIGAQAEATLTPQETGDYNLGVKANGFVRVTVDGKQVASGFQPGSVGTSLGRVHLEKGKPVKLAVNYSPLQSPDMVATLVWTKVDLKPQPEAIAAARDADVVVAVVGITSELEGEEMPVQEDGFKGGDRTSLDLPKPEQELLEALAATGKPLVVVLTNGSALGVNWAKEHANAILDAWYPGEEGGAAVAETLSGHNNPAGRLPVTFYKDVSQLPAFEDYSMKGRTYRYFQGTPLFPFGYGLSYTSFGYSGLTGPSDAIEVGSPATFEVTVTNTGKRAGDEVAQLYLTFPDVPGAPLRALRGFQRVHLEAGGSQKVRFELKTRDLSMVTEAGDPIIAEGQYTVSVGGGQPISETPALSTTFKVKGMMKLPE
jgi:beta-glucosidase